MCKPKEPEPESEETGSRLGDCHVSSVKLLLLEENLFRLLKNENSTATALARYLNDLNEDMHLSRNLPWK